MKNNEAQDVIDPDQVIESYKYGSDLITVSEEAKVEYKYDAGAKAMTVVGFIPQAKIPRSHLVGDGCMAFQPLQEDEVGGGQNCQRRSAACGLHPFIFLS